MTKTVTCDIVSAEEALYSGEITWMTVTGEQGELGIYPGHAPLLTAIAAGPVHLKTADGEDHVFYLSGGYLEVLPTEIKILADIALRAKDLDEAAAEEVRQEAARQLLTQKGEFDYGKAAIQLAEATAQLKTVQELKKAK
ncbi:MAG: F0F1 ATP synthase subunit epsilon [Endozoicomonadaceae bacterium]|nr:F0F1 ATP synthase subunit epsilon [Endozoicomonadaceae bacterium]